MARYRVKDSEPRTIVAKLKPNPPMRLRDRLSTLFSPPAFEYYQCKDCGSHFGESHETCPNCGSDHIVEATQDNLVYYWGGM